MKKEILLFVFVLTSFIINAQVTANPPSDIEVCDTNNDGFAFFDLTLTEPEIIGEQDPTNLFISFYITQPDAINDTNPIAAPMNYFSDSSTIYARITDVSNGDFDTTSFFILVRPIPVVVNPITDLEVYDENGDGVAVFNLNSKISEILGTQTDVGVTFYETNLDAINNVNPILDSSSYLNISNPQNIYVRLEFNLTGCFATTSFIIFANPNLGTFQNSILELSIFPNPTTGVFNLHFSSLIEEVEVSIINLQGQQIKKIKLENLVNSYSLNVSDLTAGMYFIKISSEDDAIVKRILKK